MVLLTTPFIDDLYEDKFSVTIKLYDRLPGRKQARVYVTWHAWPQIANRWSLIHVGYSLNTDEKLLEIEINFFDHLAFFLHDKICIYRFFVKFKFSEKAAKIWSYRISSYSFRGNYSFFGFGNPKVTVST